MTTALDLALIDIGVWGAGLITAGTVIALRVADRARLVNPTRTAAQPQADAASAIDITAARRPA